MLSNKLTTCTNNCGHHANRVETYKTILEQTTLGSLLAFIANLPPIIMVLKHTVKYHANCGLIQTTGKINNVIEINFKITYVTTNASGQK